MESQLRHPLHRRRRYHRRSQNHPPAPLRCCFQRPPRRLPSPFFSSAPFRVLARYVYNQPPSIRPECAIHANPSSTFPPLFLSSREPVEQLPFIHIPRGEFSGPPPAYIHGMRGYYLPSLSHVKGSGVSLQFFLFLIKKRTFAE